MAALFAAVAVSVSALAASLDPYEANAACPPDTAAAVGLSYGDLRAACFPETGAAMLDCGQIRTVASRTGDPDWPEGDAAAAAFGEWCAYSGDRSWPHGVRNYGARDGMHVGTARFPDGSEGCSAPVAIEVVADRVSFRIGEAAWSGRINSAGWVHAAPADGSGAAFGPLHWFSLQDAACGEGTVEAAPPR